MRAEPYEQGITLTASALICQCPVLQPVSLGLNLPYS